jgi:hypothetical protein
MRWLLLIIATGGFGLLLAQETEQRTISVQLSRNVWVTPDVAVVSATIAARDALSIADAAALLKPAGFAESDVSDGSAVGPNVLPDFAVFPPPQGAATASYVFVRRMPVGQLRSVLTPLAAIPNTASVVINFQAYFEFSEGLTTQVKQRQLPDMLAEARREANSIAAKSAVLVKELAAVQEVSNVAIAASAFLLGNPFPQFVNTLGPGMASILIGVLSYLPPASPIRVQYNFDFLLQ